MKRTILLASLLGTVLVTASGCKSLATTLGFEKQPPDEYTVVENAPLTMPPDFGLRAPSANAGKAPDSDVHEQAQDTVFSAGSGGAASAAAPVASPGLSPGETALLDQAGAANSNSAIRTQIDQENATNNGNNSLIDRILFWHHGTSKDETLDAQKESARIQSDAAAGKPVTDGSAPAIQRTNRTIFDAL